MISLRKWDKLTANQINLDDEFCRPVLPHNQILCLHHFNLRSLYIQFLQSLPNWIQLHTSGTSAICTPFQWIKNKNTFSCYSLQLGQFQLKLFYCGNGRQNFASNVTPVNVPAKITRCMKNKVCQKGKAFLSATAISELFHLVYEK